MKLLIATPYTRPSREGPATHTRLLEQGLPERGISVDVVKFADVRSYPRVFRHFIYFIKLIQAARHADLLLVQDTVSCGVPAALAAKLSKIPLIVRVPGDYAWEQGRQRFGITSDLDTFQGERNNRSVSFLQRIQSWTVRQGSLVIVPSNYFASIVSGWGVAPDRLQVIYHGMPALKSVLAPTVEPANPYMVSIGRLVPWKGFAFLIALLPALPEWRLVIVGNGPDRTMLEKAAKSAGVEDRVIFTGGVPHEEALGWCASADVFVLNTSFESFSFQVLEAVALGSRIITTNIGSIPELITNEQQGILLIPDDTEGFKKAIESVRIDLAVWEGRKESAQLRAQDFSVERMLDRTAEKLKALV